MRSWGGCRFAGRPGAIRRMWTGNITSATTGNCSHSNWRGELQLKPMNRRRWQWIIFAAGLLAYAASGGAANGSDALKVFPDKIDGTAPGAMMDAYLKRRAFAALDRRDAEFEKIKTPEQLAAYQKR